MKSTKKKLLIFLSVAVLIIVIFGISELISNRVNKKEITKLNEELRSNTELSKYFTSINASEDTIGKPLEYLDYKVYSFNILGSGNEKFSSLSDTEKINQLEEISKIARKYYANSSSFIDCGKNKFCDIEEIVIFGSIGGGSLSDSYSIKFETNGSPDEMEITYYDENEKRQTRTISNNSISTNSTPSSNSNSKSALNKTATWVKPLTLEETSCSKDGGYMYAKGYVKNNSDQFISFIEVKADYLDSLGNIIDTDFTYAVGSEGLAPNSRKSFDIMTPSNDSVTKCNYLIVDYK